MFRAPTVKMILMTAATTTTTNNDVNSVSAAAAAASEATEVNAAGASRAAATHYASSYRGNKNNEDNSNSNNVISNARQHLPALLQSLFSPQQSSPSSSPTTLSSSNALLTSHLSGNDSLKHYRSNASSARAVARARNVISLINNSFQHNSDAFAAEEVYASANNTDLVRRRASTATAAATFSTSAPAHAVLPAPDRPYYPQVQSPGVLPAVFSLPSTSTSSSSSLSNSLASRAQQQQSDLLAPSSLVSAFFKALNHNNADVNDNDGDDDYVIGNNNVDVDYAATTATPTTSFDSAFPEDDNDDEYANENLNLITWNLFSPLPVESSTMVSDLNVSAVYNSSSSLTPVHLPADTPTGNESSVAYDILIIVLGVIYTSIIITSLFGNFLVVLAVLKSNRLRSITHYLLMWLAIADLGVTILVMPFSLIYDLTLYWNFGWLLCKVWISWDVTCCTASLQHLVLISLDRYLAISDPLRYHAKVTKGRIGVLVVVIWIVSASIAFVPIFLGWYRRDSVMQLAEGMCGLEEIDGTYAVISSSISFYIPLAFMLVFYVRIFAIARRQAQEIMRIEKTMRASQVNLISSTAVPATLQQAVAVSTTVNEGDPNGSQNHSASTSPVLPISSSATGQQKPPLIGVAANGGIRRSLEEKRKSSTKSSSASTALLLAARRSTGGSVTTSSHTAVSHTTIVTNAASESGVTLSKAERWHEKQQGGRRSSASSTSYSASDTKAIKTLGIIFGMFYLCWQPFFIMWVVLAVCPACDASFPPIARSIITWLGYLNSSMNPIIYSLNADFRIAYLRLISSLVQFVFPPTCCPTFCTWLPGRDNPADFGAARRRNFSEASAASNQTVKRYGTWCSRLLRPGRTNNQSKSIVVTAEGSAAIVANVDVDVCVEKARDLFDENATSTELSPLRPLVDQIEQASSQTRLLFIPEEKSEVWKDDVSENQQNFSNQPTTIYRAYSTTPLIPHQSSVFAQQNAEVLATPNDKDLLLSQADNTNTESTSKSIPTEKSAEVTDFPFFDAGSSASIPSRKRGASSNSSTSDKMSSPQNYTLLHDETIGNETGSNVSEFSLTPKLTSVAMQQNGCIYSPLSDDTMMPNDIIVQRPVSPKAERIGVPRMSSIERVVAARRQMKLSTASLPDTSAPVWVRRPMSADAASLNCKTKQRANVNTPGEQQECLRVASSSNSQGAENVSVETTDCVEVEDSASEYVEVRISGSSVQVHKM